MLHTQQRLEENDHETEREQKAVINALEIVQLQGKEEIRALKTAYFLAENKLAHSEFRQLVKCMK